MSFLLLTALWPAGAQAASDPLVEGAKLCTRHLVRYEREYGVPTHLLSAIASTESGRYDEGLKIKVPWPWTIDADGKSYFFDSKDKAVAAVRRLKAEGAKSIDVGCMQVNLQQHPRAFASLDEAFDPQINIAYAAGFLRSLYDADNSWKKAAADYHSKTPALGSRYVGQVYDSWYQIISKLRAARLHVPESSVVAMNDMKSASNIIRVTSRQPEHSKKVYHSPHMDSISVSYRRAAPGVIVVKPDIVVANDAQSAPVPNVTVKTRTQSVPVTQARAIPVNAVADVAAADTATMVSLPVASSKKTGPTFIFSD